MKLQPEVSLSKTPAVNRLLVFATSDPVVMRTYLSMARSDFHRQEVSFVAEFVRIRQNSAEFGRSIVGGVECAESEV
jgi:hypothetical protein